MRRSLNDALAKNKKFKNFWKTCKKELEEEIKMNEEKTEKLVEEKLKRKEYLKMYKSEKSIAHEMSKLYEDQESRMSDLLNSKAGWMPVGDYYDTKTQLEEAQKQCKKHLERVTVLR